MRLYHYCLLIGFAIYEITEQWSIGDAAYLDFENFWVFAVFTGLIYYDHTLMAETFGVDDRRSK